MNKAICWETCKNVRPSTYVVRCVTIIVPANNQIRPDGSSGDQMGPGSGGGYKCIRGTRPLSSVLDRHNLSPITMWNITFIPCLVSCPMADSLHIVCVCLQPTIPALMNLCPTNRREVQTNMQSTTDQWESRARGSRWPPQQTILVADDIPY